MYFRSNMLILYISYEYSNLCFDVEYPNLHIVGTPSKQDPFNPTFIEVSDALLKTLQSKISSYRINCDYLHIIKLVIFEVSDA